MDEIVIGDKKYVSSKRAAELTGYAKDYVGQLCREGRVEARLVGRNWYVLAAAIQDHRFGEPKEEIEEIKEAKEEKPPVVSETWDTPRYKSEESASLPSINRLAETKFEPQERNEAEEPVEEKSSIEAMQGAWREWFTKVVPEDESLPPEIEKEPESEVEEAVELEIKQIEREEEPIEEEVVEVEVPIVRQRRGKSSVGAKMSLFVLGAVALGFAYLGSPLANAVIIEKLHLVLVSGVDFYQNDNVAQSSD